MAQGATTSLFEISEVTIAILLFLLISAGILIVYNPDLIYSKTLTNQVSYIASIKGDKNYQIKIKVDDTKNIKLENKKQENEIILNVGDAQSKSNYFGQNINIEKQDSQIIIS